MALAEGPDYATRAMFLRLAAVADGAEVREAGYHRPSRGFRNNLRPAGNKCHGTKQAGDSPGRRLCACAAYWFSCVSKTHVQ